MDFFGQVPQARSRRQKENDNKTMTCQKCLKIGHWTYECKSEKAYVQRESISQRLKLNKAPTFLSELPPGEKSSIVVNDTVMNEKSKISRKKKRYSSSSDSDSSSDSSDSSSSDSSSSSSSSSSSGSGSSSSSSNSSSSSSSSSDSDSSSDSSSSDSSSSSSSSSLSDSSSSSDSETSKSDNMKKSRSFRKRKSRSSTSSSSSNKKRLTSVVAPTDKHKLSAYSPLVGFKSTGTDIDYGSEADDEGEK